MVLLACNARDEHYRAQHRHKTFGVSRGRGEGLGEGGGGGDIGADAGSEQIAATDGVICGEGGGAIRQGVSIHCSSV